MQHLQHVGSFIERANIRIAVAIDGDSVTVGIALLDQAIRVLEFPPATTARGVFDLMRRSRTESDMRIVIFVQRSRNGSYVVLLIIGTQQDLRLPGFAVPKGISEICLLGRQI